MHACCAFFTREGRVCARELFGAPLWAHDSQSVPSGSKKNKAKKVRELHESEPYDGKNFQSRKWIKSGSASKLYVQRGKEVKKKGRAVKNRRGRGNRG